MITKMNEKAKHRMKGRVSTICAKQTSRTKHTKEHTGFVLVAEGFLWKDKQDGSLEWALDG